MEESSNPKDVIIEIDQDTDHILINNKEVGYHTPDTPEEKDSVEEKYSVKEKDSVEEKDSVNKLELIEENYSQINNEREIKKEIFFLKEQIKKMKENENKSPKSIRSNVSDLSTTNNTETNTIDSTECSEDCAEYNEIHTEKNSCKCLGCVCKKTNKNKYKNEDVYEIKLYSDNDDSETKDEWTDQRKHHFQKCLWKLKYNRVVSDVFLNNLKKEEENWSWGLITLSTFTSGLTVANNVEEEPFDNYNIVINGALTFMSMLTSFCAAWIKKKNYVDKINEIDKYVQNINHLCEELEVQLTILDTDRLKYKQFKKLYLTQITNILSTSPIIPPDEWKKCIQEITLKYPELINPDNSEENKLWPWFGDMVKQVNKKTKEEKYIRKKTAFMDQMRSTKTERLKSSCCFDVRDEKDIYD